MVNLKNQDFDYNCKSYSTKATFLKNQIKFDVLINHVGSTAIPAIEYEKNIIDIFIGVHNRKEF